MVCRDLRRLQYGIGLLPNAHTIKSNQIKSNQIDEAWTLDNARETCPSVANDGRRIVGKVSSVFQAKP